MAVHIFTVSEENYKVCVDKGLVAIPEPKDSPKKNEVTDALISRLSGIKEDDYVLIYVIKTQSLFGVWKIKGLPFYEETQVWTDRLYPFRCRIEWSDYCFQNVLKLKDINDLRNAGKIWTWALERAHGSNAMFSISDSEFSILLNEYLKINPFSFQRGITQNPYPYRTANILEGLHFDKYSPKFEYTIMALLNHEFSKKSYQDIFGNYTDYISYVPTNLGTEMDFLLMYNNPLNAAQIMSYDIIEVKRDKFNDKALKQLIEYEAWLLQNKVSGNSNMVRTTAIAKSYTEGVIQYVLQRAQIENKPIKLLQYNYDNGYLNLVDITKK